MWVNAVAPGGLDAPYDPTAEEGDRAEIDDQVKRWEEWQGYAKARGFPMTTYRHVIEFMVELRLIDRREEGTCVSWTIVSPLPDVEEVLPLTPERRQHEALVRWREQFSEISEVIDSWIGQFQLPSAESLVIETSIQDLAAELGLDPEDARHGLAVLLDDDIRCDPDPETAIADATLKITVNWKLFEEWRMPYRATPPKNLDR
jgi:hypothetical protein